MKISTNQFKNGTKLIIDNAPCVIVEHEFHKPGKGQAVMRVKYRNLLTFDGGFSKYPYVDGKYADVHITPSYWEDRKKNKLSQPANLNIKDYTTLFSKKEHDLKIMYLQGYEDAKNNRHVLDSLFLRKKNEK